MKRLNNIVLCMFLGLISYAQQPELTVEQHLEDYDCAVKYIEDNYSGFHDKVMISTRDEYEALKSRLRSQISKGERPGWDAFAEYTAWFDDSHLSIHKSFTDDKGKRINWTDYYSKKKSIDYSSMEYGPVPVACKVTDKTFLIRFPSCGGNPNMKWILNSIKKFKKSHCENLVIDIRGNGGGNDANWYPFLKLLYDHSAWRQGQEYRNTPQNIDYLLKENWNGPGFAKHLKELSEQYPDREFIGDSRGLYRYNKVDKTVKRAALLIDNRVASSGEGMVTWLRACSNRLMVYGRDNTCGCIDHANVAGIAFKHYKVTFQMPMSRDPFLPLTAIDPTGIAPDVRIPLPLPARLTDNIDEWVIWVAEQLEK